MLHGIHVSIAICTQVSFYILLDVCWKQLAGDEDDAFQYSELIATWLYAFTGYLGNTQRYPDPLLRRGVSTTVNSLQTCGRIQRCKASRLASAAVVPIMQIRVQSLQLLYANKPCKTAPTYPRTNLLTTTLSINSRYPLVG